ncbi:MAG: putative secreted protein [Marmoricola sp.]|nr:putative secreted protein [Marmoricola sp.]
MSRHLDTTGHARLRSRRWRLLAVVLAVGAVACVAAGWARDDTGSATAETTTAPQSTPVSLAPPGPSSAKNLPTSRVPGARPTALKIPAIGVSTSVVPLGLNADGTVEVPADPDKAGWYRRASQPGQAGSAVILGHVDSDVGPAVFYHLKTLTVGDKVDVVRVDGSVAEFKVAKLVTYANQDFPAQKVYGYRSHPTLTLVTCGGDYDRSAGGYQANVVVFTKFVGITRTAA